jgi:hypothetical protein
VTVTELAFKFLAPGRQPCNGGSGAWPEPGVWTPRVRRVVPCESGYHGCRSHQLIDWPGPQLWRAEFEDVTDCGDKIVGARARLLERVEAWDDRAARLFACDCAERVVRLTGPDGRIVAAIAMARRFAGGEASAGELAAARAAALAVAEAVAEAAAVAGAVAVAAAAAWAAAGAVARAEAFAAARTAASDAARAEAWIAGAAGWAAERSWQNTRLLETLGLAEAA